MSLNSNFKWPIALMVILSLLYRLAFNDSIASNYETPPGYSAPKSIAQIEEEERLAFEKALSESTQEKPAPVKIFKPKVRKLATKRKGASSSSKILSLVDYKLKRKPVRKLN